MFISLFNLKLWKRIIFLLYTYIPYVFNFIFYREYFYSNKNIDNLEKSIVKCGCVSIKIIQWLSQRMDILHPLLIERFKRLQINCPMINLKDLIKNPDFVFIKDLDNVSLYKFKNQILEIEQIAIGTASIAQVHKSKINGIEIVIKIRISNILDNIKYDLIILKWLNKIFSNNTLQINYLCDLIMKQTNLINEKENLLKIKKIFENNDSIKLPEIIYAEEDYLIETYCYGIPINKVSDNLNYRLKLINALMIMINSGFVHGDLHDGNILCHDENIYLIDFGIVLDLTINEIKIIKEFIIAYHNFYYNGKIDGFFTLMKHFTQYKLTLSQRDNFNKIFENFIIKENNKYLFRVNNIYSIFIIFLKFIKKYKMKLNNNFMHILLMISIIEANIYNIYNINFVDKLYIKINLLNK